WLKIERIPGVLASSYEKATRLAIDAYYSPVAGEIVSNFRRGTLLDLGTGPGYLPIEIVKRACGVHIVGVDLSRKLIQMATANALEAGVSDHVKFEVGNAGRLRFNDQAFDMVTSTGMLHSLKNPINVLLEINRVLKKGGESWIYDPARIIQFIDRKKWKASLNIRERFFLRFFGLLGLHKPIAVYRRDQVIPMIEAAGFKIHTIEEDRGEIRIKIWK
ncbi:MAG: class I SAM-dependent methyltransferase, partial [Deltaproteobacteria bacterium]|nr:class I SAM-dependent methyltransferase [Deltaproteobacteria bacterium]